MAKGKRKQLRKRALRESSSAVVSPPDAPESKEENTPVIEDTPVKAGDDLESPPQEPTEESEEEDDTGSQQRLIGPDCNVEDSIPGGCTIIPYNISLEEWASGAVHLPQVKFDMSGIKLSPEIYQRAAAVTEECKKSEALQPYFCGGEFDNVFMVEFGDYVCLSPITSTFRIQANQLLNLITDTGRNPYGNSIILQIRRTNKGYNYHNVSRKRALRFLSGKLADMTKACLERNPLLRSRYWVYDPECKEGVELFGNDKEVDDLAKWGYDTKLMAFHYKTHKCHRVRTHLKQTCPFYHSLLDARRPLSLFKYSSKRCSAGAEDCIHGVHCNLSHNEYEHFYHPDFLRHSECMHWKQNGNCKGPLCSFFHEGEMSPPVGKKEPPAIALPASLSGIGPPGGLARSATRVPRYGLNAPLTQSFSPSTRLRTSFSQEGIIFSLKDSQSGGKKKLSSSGEVRPPGVKSSTAELNRSTSIKDSTLQCRYDYPQSELRDSEESQSEPAPISIAYQYQLKCQEVLVSYALCVLQKIFGPEDWLAQVTGFLLNSKTDISLLDPSLWDLNLIRDIILHLKHDDTLVFGEPYAITNAVLEFFSAPLPTNDEEQFHFWCFLVQVLKMEAIHQDFLPVQALVHQYEEFVENQDDSDVKVPTEHSLEYWQLFQRYMWQPSVKEPTTHVLIIVGALPPFDHTAGVLYLSHVEWDLVLDFGLTSNNVLKDIFILQNSEHHLIHDGFINDCNLDALDPLRALSWFNMRPLQSDLLPEDYSRTIIGGRQDIVLQRYMQVKRSKRLHCTVMAYDPELTNNPLLNSHLNHVLNTLNRLPDCRVTFTTFTDEPGKVRSLLYEPKMRRSIESISFAQVCNGFQTVTDPDRLRISLPSQEGEVSVAALYRTICPYFQILFLERRRFHIETTRSAKLNWAKGGPLPWQLLEREDHFFPLQRKAFQECLHKLNEAIADARAQPDTPIELQINFAHEFEANTTGRQLLWEVHEQVPALINLFTEDISPSDVEKVSKMLRRLHRATQQVIVCMVDPTICNASRVTSILRPLALPLVILHVGVGVAPTAGARRFAVSSHLTAEESQRLVGYLSDIVEENDPDSAYTLAKIRQRLDKLHGYSLHPSLFLYTTLFRLQKSANVESFVFGRLDAAQLAPHHLMWLMCIAFTSRFADEALESKYLLQASQQPLSELENWVEGELIKELIVMDQTRENVMTLNITVANEIIKWICANEDISVADMTVRFIDSIVPHDLESTAPLAEIIFKLFYRIDHEDSFTELISCLSKEDTATILTYIKAILPTTYSACGLARFLWTRGEQTEENTTKINELMEEAFTLCTNPYEQYYYYLSHGIMFATMFKYYVACSNSSNWRRILPVANNLHKRACSNFFKARGRLYGRLSYSTDYLLFPYILELSVRSAFLNYFLQAIMESMGPVKANFQVTNYYLVSSEKPSSLEDSRSICIELLHKLELFVQFQKDPVLLTAYKVERDHSLVRTSLERVEAIKSSLSPLLGDGQAQFIALSDLCSTENRLSYEIRRMSIWNLSEQYRKNKMASWYNADAYVQQALEFINHNVQPADTTGSSFRDFDMVSWLLLLRLAHSEEEPASILPTLTSWCLKTTKLTNNHPIIANYYRYICLFLVWAHDLTDLTQKEAFLKSLKTCQNLVESHSYPATVAEYCHEFVGASTRLDDLCPLDRLAEKEEKGAITSFEGQLVPVADKPVSEWTVSFHDVAFPLATLHTWAHGSQPVEATLTDPMPIRFSVMFSWANPKAFHLAPL